MGLLDKIAGNYSEEPKEENYSSKAKALISNAFSDIEEGKFFDYHMHILGLGTNNSGIWLSPDLHSFLHPLDSIKTQAYINAAGIRDMDRADIDYIDQLLIFIETFPVKGKFCLLALDKCYNKDGEPDEKNSKLHIPNDWIFPVCMAFKDKFIPCISVNPYRNDALEELEKWARRGVKMMKWMPATMGMDASDKKCEAFYEKMKEHDMVLLTHVGKEDNIPVTKFQPLNNPLLFRKPLDMGVKVIMAHCASAGSNPDLDKKEKLVKNHHLFLRLMDEPKYEGLLFGDISAITQINRMGESLKLMLERTDLHSRLVHGSDYPLPAMNAIISTKLLYKAGYLRKEDQEPLNEIYKINPLLFDYVVKRRLKHPKDSSMSFSSSIFMHKPELGIPENW